MVGSAILNDQGLQDSSETKGVKEVSMPDIAASKLLTSINRFERLNTVAQMDMKRSISKHTPSTSCMTNSTVAYSCINTVTFYP